MPGSVLRPASLITADAGYHSEQNPRTLEAQGIDALGADNGMHQRDERFATQGRHQQDPDPLHRRSQTLAEFAGFVASGRLNAEIGAGPSAWGYRKCNRRRVMRVAVDRQGDRITLRQRRGLVVDADRSGQ